MTVSSKHQQSGLSRIEISLAVAIAAVVMLGSMYAISRIIHADKVNKQISSVSNVFGKVKRQYQMQANTSGVSVSSLAPLGVWSSERLKKEGDTWTVSGVVTGSTEYMASNSEAINSIPPQQAFIYTLHKLPKDMCAETIKGLEKTVFAAYVADPKDYVLGSTMPKGTVVKANEDAAIAPDTLGTACESISGNLVTITLVNRLTN